jgi:hypothetical protein
VVTSNASDAVRPALIAASISYVTIGSTAAGLLTSILANAYVSDTQAVAIEFSCPIVGW